MIKAIITKTVSTGIKTDIETNGDKETWRFQDGS
jgi:hypothetical protein